MVLKAIYPFIRVLSLPLAILSLCPSRDGILQFRTSELRVWHIICRRWYFLSRQFRPMRTCGYPIRQPSFHIWIKREINMKINCQQSWTMVHVNDLKVWEILMHLGSSSRVILTWQSPKLAKNKRRQSKLTKPYISTI